MGNDLSGVQITDCALANTESSSGHFQDTLDINRKLHHLLVLFDHRPQEFTVFQNGLPFFVEVFLYLDIAGNFVGLL